MTTPKAAPKQYHIGGLRIEIHPIREAAGEAAAQAAAESMRGLAASKAPFAVIFATGGSQVETLRALTATPGLPWSQVIGFHMDEYVGISPDHPGSFRRYMREHLTERVKLREFHEIDGSKSDPARTAAEYAALLRFYNPQLCLFGIGENGHLAFNDPAEARFWDPLPAKVVSLDQTCRRQQVAEGWFPNVEAVPAQAITLTIPTLMQVPRLILTVPGERKAEIMARALQDPISTACPATILRAHANATIYLDADSAAQIAGILTD